MITFTPEAISEIKNLTQQNIEQDKYLRLVVEDSCCSSSRYGMGFDTARDNDLKFDTADLPYIIDPESYELMQGAIVHFNGASFEIKVPSKGCGCGRNACSTEDN